MQKLKKYILTLLLCCMLVPLFSQVVSFRLTASSESQNIFASELYGAKWMSLNHFFKTYGNIDNVNTEEWSQTASLSGKQYKFFANSTFYQINGKWLHLPTTVERLS